MDGQFVFVNTLAYGGEMKSNNLSSQDWIAAAFKALTAGGPQAIKVEAIARHLKVSKGSFYWHFANVDALKSQMLEHWYEMATSGIIANIDATSGKPEDKLTALVDLVSGNLSEAYGGVSVEAAIRDWGKYSKQVGDMIKKVDHQRLDFLIEQFAAYGYDRKNSRSCAAILYAGLIGLETLAAQEMADIRSDLHILLQRLL
jgi:AcrR family transcriptional regulator